MGDGHLRKGKGLHVGGEAGRRLRAVEDVPRGEAGGSLQAVEDVLRGEAGGSLQAVEDVLRGEAGGSLQAVEDVLRGEAGGSLRHVEDVLRGEGRQAASEEGAVLPVERVGAAAAVDCSFCRTCDVIKTSPPSKG